MTMCKYCDAWFQETHWKNTVCPACKKRRDNEYNRKWRKRSKKYRVWLKDYMKNPKLKEYHRRWRERKKLLKNE